MGNSIFVTRPYMPELSEYIKYLEVIWENKWLSNNGPFHQELENKLAEYLGVKYISLFSNGTLALITSLQALKISGEVITTPYSFVATTHSLWWNNIKPVFVDIENKFYNIDAYKIESAINERTTAILPVHVYGNPCNVEKINKIAQKYKLKVLYDAAHAFGVKINENSILNYGDLSVLSFHATKVFSTIEGGAVISHSAEMKHHLDNLKNFGFRGETIIEEPGINAKLNEFQAAYGLLQLKNIDIQIARRKELTLYYRNKLRGIFGIELLEEIKDIKHTYTYFPIRIINEKFGISRDDVYEKLRINNIFSRKYFYPLISSLDVYSKLPSSSLDNLKNATCISNEILCLPLYVELTENEIDLIINIILKKNEL